MLCDCIFRLCVIQAFSFNIKVDGFIKEEPIAVYNNYIVCLNNQHHKISAGDYILYTSNDKVKIACIKNIQLNGEKIEFIGENESKDIGLQLDNTIKEKDKLKVVVNAMR